MESFQGASNPALIHIAISYPNTQCAISAVDLCHIPRIRLHPHSSFLLSIRLWFYVPGVETSPSLPVPKIAYPLASNTH
jgi:hypothetical protein